MLKSNDSGFTVLRVLKEIEEFILITYRVIALSTVFFSFLFVSTVSMSSKSKLTSVELSVQLAQFSLRVPAIDDHTLLFHSHFAILNSLSQSKLFHSLYTSCDINFVVSCTDPRNT